VIKDRQATLCNTNWTLGDSRKQGKKLVEGFTKIILRAFNGECDAAVSKVKYNNIQVLENRLNKAYEELNKIAEIFQCSISHDFLNLKLQELWLTHGYQEKKNQEQEEQRAIREQMKEEEKALRELEKARQNAEREEQRYQQALDKARAEVETASGKAQQDLLQKIAQLQQQVAEAEVNRQRAISQAQLTKSGHVYVISNIGSFGENIYKIGMTRRLDPMDRVKELGDASVPFPFDVHAMIYCGNAPEMEKLLHKRFHHLRLNRINERKEFFRVSLGEIVAAVREIDTDLEVGQSEIEFTMVAEAVEYRRTLAHLQAMTEPSNPAYAGA
jgi:flagellar biosynthesis GTPase FlhF